MSKASAATVIWLLAASISCARAAAPRREMQCTYTVMIRPDSARNGLVAADVIVVVALPKDAGTVFVPLPFGESEDTDLAIDPSGSYSFVLHGFFRPEGDMGACEIASDGKPQQLKLRFYHVLLPIQSIAGDQPRQSVLLLLDKSRQALSATFKDAPTPLVSKVSVRGVAVTQAEPPGRYSDETRQFEIESPSQSAGLGDITVYFTLAKRQYMFYVILGILGALPGYLSTLALPIRTARRAVLCIILALSGIAALLYVLVYVTTPEQRWGDMTIISLVGSGFGLLLGLFSGAVQALLPLIRPAATRP